MKFKSFKKTALFSFILILGVTYGYLFGKHNVFPYKFVESIVDKFNDNDNGPYSIGIYEGDSPFNLSEPKGINNPVLTADDVDDIDAKFVADPFMTFHKNNYYMFFEVLNRTTKQGDIGYAQSLDGKKWDYKKIILDEDFHLSYPYVFEWENNYYLIPESNEDFSVRLYKATSFPDKWEYQGNILSGFRFTDPSIFRYSDKWWMYVSAGDKHDVVNLFYSDDLLSGWQPHPINPILKNDSNFSRPGGRVLNFNDKLYRFAQDDYPYYAMQVYAFEILELTDSTYVEKLTSEKPILTKSGKGWNAEGMHHIDANLIKEKKLVVVDGKNK